MHPNPDDAKFAMLVEGEDDKYFLANIINRNLDPSLSVSIHARTGYSDVLKAIPLEIKVSGREVLGIILDANDDLMKRWLDIRQALNGVIDTNIPKKPKTGGTIIKSSKRCPRIGIWLMPDNMSKGELEDFVIKMIPTDDAIWPRAQTYINGIPTNIRKFKESKQSRAELYAWLATRELPGRIGYSIKQGDLDINGQLTQQFIGWLKLLFR